MSDSNKSKNSGAYAQSASLKDREVIEEWYVPNNVVITPDEPHQRPGTGLEITGLKGVRARGTIPSGTAKFLMLDNVEQAELRFYRPALNIHFKIDAVIGSLVASLVFYDNATEVLSVPLKNDINDINYEHPLSITHMVLNVAAGADRSQLNIDPMYWQE